ncbi:helix-turn-helix transcriptional regulator [Ovoidimarina sediminis]|uniref:helix-turn-helix transcriptional regulator n=1 Tax=Ovoidimarina sediminis TaxID=3079856 RepID=UPI002911C78C|nr:helix-turn-helix transcriptional regulator [Rhodophyticola sp. MJ-SS7]MDU8945475.1 helix-turn-helix transcriptional regulator [Rhodophyticola sp. MJ-SS7]
MPTDWNQQSARCLDALGSPAFPETLAAGIRSIVPYEFMVVFGYVGTKRPLALYDDFTPERRKLHVDEYLEGPYLIDPFFLASTGDTPSGIWRLRDIAPDRFYQGEYFRSYYAQTGLAEEVGFLIDVNAELSIVVSLMRTERKFSKAEFRVLTEIQPIVDALCRRHWSTGKNGARSDASKILTEKVSDAFRTIGDGVLTPRESEVVELTLRGHSSEAIGRLLEISPGTVRIHRRNVYSKLRINSQGELFSVFLNTIGTA